MEMITTIKTEVPKRSVIESALTLASAITVIVGFPSSYCILLVVPVSYVVVWLCLTVLLYECD